MGLARNRTGISWSQTMYTTIILQGLMSLKTLGVKTPSMGIEPISHGSENRYSSIKLRGQWSFGIVAVKPLPGIGPGFYTYKAYVLPLYYRGKCLIRHLHLFCDHRELNPGLLGGGQKFYHWTMDAVILLYYCGLTRDRSWTCNRRFRKPVLFQLSHTCDDSFPIIASYFASARGCTWVAAVTVRSSTVKLHWPIVFRDYWQKVFWSAFCVSKKE